MKFKIIITIVLFLISLLFTNNTYGQNKEEAVKDLHTFNVYFINGYGISYDAYKHNNSTLRLYLDFNGYGDELESSSHQIYSNPTTNFEVKSNSENFTDSFVLLISPQFLHKLYKSDLGEIYFGSGPYFEYRNNSYWTPYRTAMPVLASPAEAPAHEGKAWAKAQSMAWTCTNANRQKAMGKKSKGRKNPKVKKVSKINNVR